MISCSSPLCDNHPNMFITAINVFYRFVLVEEALLKNPRFISRLFQIYDIKNSLLFQPIHFNQILLRERYWCTWSSGYWKKQLKVLTFKVKVILSMFWSYYNLNTAFKCIASEASENKRREKLSASSIKNDRSAVGCAPPLFWSASALGYHKTK